MLGAAVGAAVVKAGAGAGAEVTGAAVTRAMVGVGAVGGLEVGAQVSLPCQPAVRAWTQPCNPPLGSMAEVQVQTSRAWLRSGDTQ